MNRPRMEWRLVGLVATPFAIAVAMSLWIWQRRPPVEGLTGTATYGRNVPGDLSAALSMCAVEFVIALLLAQPWTLRPNRVVLGLAGLGFGAWGLLNLVMLHSPPVMLPHTLLVLVVAMGFWAAIPALSIARRFPQQNANSLGGSA
jgi:hypothetical protein